MSNVISQKSKVFVAMSGGVDSSVAAASLKKQGYEVVGVHMKCYNVDGCAEQDAEDARRVAEVLGIPFYVFDFEKEYKEKVVEYMVNGYRQGITPNPDVMCNKEIKFGLFLKKALEMGADYVATGHYVRLRTTIDNKQLTTDKRNKNIGQMSNVKCQMFAAKDSNKDQSYFLWTLAQEQLWHCLFPIGDYWKSEVRVMAKKFDLPNAEKKDSQGICFLGQVTLKDFLGSYLPEKRGLVLNTAGKVVGEHSGAHFYTIGQRHLGFNQQPTTNNQQPLYVAEKDVQENAILVAEENSPALYKNEINLRQVNFIDQRLTIDSSRRVWVRVRYRQPLFPATLKISRKLSAVSCKLTFDERQKFVAAGQSAVFYDGHGKMLGGGIIA